MRFGISEAFATVGEQAMCIHAASLGFHLPGNQREDVHGLK
jgi:hypothetical protein